MGLLWSSHIHLPSTFLQHSYPALARSLPPVVLVYIQASYSLASGEMELSVAMKKHAMLCISSIHKWTHSSSPLFSTQVDNDDIGCWWTWRYVFMASLSVYLRWIWIALFNFNHVYNAIVWHEWRLYLTDTLHFENCIWHDHDFTLHGILRDVFNI